MTTASHSSTQLDRDIRSLLQKGAALLEPFGPVPSQVEAELLLRKCKVIATQLVDAHRSTTGDPKDKANSASALLHLDRAGKQTSVQQAEEPSDAKQKMLDGLSKFAYEVVAHPNVFISPEMLETYVDLQTLLNRPQSLPDVFDLYATKPVPQANTKPVRYKKPNPNKAKSAIPAHLAKAALDSAIRIKDLELALAIVDTAIATTAFRRAKLVRKALLPFTVVGLAPVAAYAVAAQASAQQLAGDGYLTTNAAFAGILAYLGFTGTLGFVALTTYNDHMDRVQWVPGTYLRERWLREEERAAVDKVAGAWGFKDRLRHGEEEGEEWEALRDWIARRGMVLDRESDMPVMQ